MINRTMEILSQLIKTKPEMAPGVKKGEMVKVCLIEKTPRAAFFEVPRLGTGTVFGKEFLNARDIIKKLEPGDEIGAKVVEVENEEGLIELSLSEADKQKSWLLVKDLQEKDEPIKVKITTANSGGLIAQICDLNAFLPVSQLSTEHYPHVPDQNKEKILEALNKFVGQELEVKIININQRTNKLIISEKEVAAQNIKELINQYKLGDVITGIISGLANFGAFIRFADNPEIEGLIHVSELSHRLIESPKEIVSVGDMVKAKIVDTKDGRISLSLKALQPDPWQNLGKKFQEGSTVKGEVFKLNPFGAFIKLSEDLTGLIHISEFGSPEEMKSKLIIGKTCDFVISSIKAEEKRIILKMA